MGKFCIVPFVIYLVGTNLASRFSQTTYPYAYAVVVFATLVFTAWQWLFLRKTEPEQLRALFQPHLRVLSGVLVGTLGIALWIMLSQLQLERQLLSYLPISWGPEDRVGFNPWEIYSSSSEIALFILLRLVGLAVAVPLAEELFWRGFLLRWLIDPDWERVPVGEFSWASNLLVVAMFTIAHPEWAAAAIYGLLINALFYWKKDLWNCIVAHAVSNLLLGAYVIAFEQWWLW